MFICGESYVIPFVFKRFSKLSNLNLLLIPDPCLTWSLFLFFINSRVPKFLRVAKGFRLALTNSGGAMEQVASALQIYMQFLCVGISESYCLSCIVLRCITRWVSITVQYVMYYLYNSDGCCILCKYLYDYYNLFVLL